MFENLLLHKIELPVLPDVIQPKDFETIIESGEWAPSPFNSQPWEFLIVEDKNKRRKIFETVIAGSEDVTFKKNSEKILLNSPFIWTVLYNTSRMDPGINAYKLGLVSIGACLSNIYLTASQLDVKIESLAFNSNPQSTKSNVSKILNLPEHVEIIMFLGMWYLSDKEKSLSEIKNNIGKKPDNQIYLNKFPEFYPLNSTKKIEINNDDIFNLIQKRKSYRKKFLQKDILPEHEFSILQSAFYACSYLANEAQQWKLLLIKDSNKRNKLADIIEENVLRLYMDKEYYSKMKTWIRFSEKDINEAEDGVFTYIYIHYLSRLFGFGVKIIDLPFLKRLKGLVIKNFAKSFFYDLVNTSPMLITFLLDSRGNSNSREEYQLDLLSLGSALQNILLASTAHGVGAQFLSILFDVEANKKKVISELELPSHIEIVDMIRLGYIDPDAPPPKYFIAQSNVRRKTAEILHVNCYETASW